MPIQNFFKSLTSTSTRRRPIRCRPVVGQLRVEPLEDRSLPSGYTFTDLGTLGGTHSDTADLNASGQVVGLATTAAGDTHAFLWNNSVMIDLGTLGGRYSKALAINDRGQIVGSAIRPDNSGSLSFFLINPEDTDGNGTPDRWFRDFNGDGANDLMVELPLNPADINNSGQVVGSANAGSVLWTPTTPNGTTGTLTDLPLYYPTAINDAGQVIGSAVIADVQHAVLWQNGVMTDLGVGRANGINGSGQVIGASAQYGAGFVWTPTTRNGPVGTFTGLEDPYRGNGSSEPFGLNNADQVVGFSAYSSWGGDGGGGGSGAGAILWNHALVSSGLPWGLESAVAINDAGLIIGHTYGDDFWYSVPSTGPWHAGLLTPIPDVPRITIGDVTVTEGNTGTRAATFTVTLSTASSQAVTVNYVTANGTATAGSDYRAASGTLTIPAGQTTGTIAILVNGDRLAEPNETFFVNLSAPTYASIAGGQGVGTILDDEPRISIGDVAKAEGRRGQTTLFTFTVTLSTAYDQPVTMSFKTVNGTATTSDSDYIAKTGTLTFAPGETSKTITIEVKGDSKREANETFYLDLYGLSLNGLFTKNRGIGTILNDD